jgi:hypothetical protein
MMRYVIEGEWSGYRSSQQRVVHREVYVSHRKISPFIEDVRKIHAIQFTDGTSLVLSVREAKPREKVEEKLSYRELIRDAIRTGIHSVDGMTMAAAKS